MSAIDVSFDREIKFYFQLRPLDNACAIYPAVGVFDRSCFWVLLKVQVLPSSSFTANSQIRYTSLLGWICEELEQIQSWLDFVPPGFRRLKCILVRRKIQCYNVMAGIWCFSSYQLNVTLMLCFIIKNGTPLIQEIHTSSNCSLLTCCCCFVV